MLRRDLRVDICGQIAKPCSQVPPGHWGEGFLFIPDITDKATGAVLIVLLILYIGSQLLSSVLMSVTADRNQRMLMIALPFVFVPFITGFPAGLILYWITTNLWTVGQQTFIRRRAGMPVGFRSQPAPTPPPRKGRDRDRDGKGEPVAVSGKRDANGATADGATNGKAPAQRPASGPPPPPPRQRKKKKTGRRR